jgi:hypothetical protein
VGALAGLGVQLRGAAAVALWFMFLTLPLLAVRVDTLQGVIEWRWHNLLALIFVVLGLGLNITVGLAGLLDLGYIAFFAVGAYTYALLRRISASASGPVLPLGGLMGHAVRHRPRLPDPAPARRLPGHRHPRLCIDHQDRLWKTGIRCSAAPAGIAGFRVRICSAWN